MSREDSEPGAPPLAFSEKWPMCSMSYALVGHRNLQGERKSALKRLCRLLGKGVNVQEVASSTALRFVQSDGWPIQAGFWLEWVTGGPFKSGFGLSGAIVIVSKFKIRHTTDTGLYGPPPRYLCQVN